jgi:predicted ester cyclase
MKEPTDLLRRLVDEVINSERLDVLDQLCTERFALKLGTAFSEFRAAFPDCSHEIVELVSNGTTVVARSCCTGTQQGAWPGIAPTGRPMKFERFASFGSPIIASGLGD